VVKSWPMEPLVYAAIVAVLLGYRLVRSFMRKASPRQRPA
jgi:sulfoxide reductase heme-binding subunit YedZ